MKEFELAGLIVRHLLIAGSVIGLPPSFSGAFWGLLAMYGVVSILFDDGVRRGNPGSELFYEMRERAHHRGS